jgi:DNA-binding response OmpR family regulator
VKELVEIHKGNIDVHSKLGEGSEFSVKIPVSKHDYPDENILDKPQKDEISGVERKNQHLVPIENEKPGPNPDDIRLQNGKLPHLLIVEDNSELRQLLAEHLAEYFTISEASNGELGIQMALEKDFDIVLSDIMMPGVNGLELCNCLKTKAETSHIPVILLTAKSADEDQLSGIEEGADDYIIKPFNINILTAKLINLVNIRQKLKERFSNEISLLPESLAKNNMDEAFIHDVVEFLKQNIQDSELNADRIASELKVSRSFVYKKIDALSGKPVNEFIRIIRLKVACELMKTPSVTLSEVAYAVGFTSLNYFSRSFKKQFNQLPSEYQKNNT